MALRERIREYREDRQFERQQIRSTLEQAFPSAYFPRSRWDRVKVSDYLTMKKDVQAQVPEGHIVATPAQLIQFVRDNPGSFVANAMQRDEFLWVRVGEELRGIEPGHVTHSDLSTTGAIKTERDMARVAYVREDVDSETASEAAKRIRKEAKEILKRRIKGMFRRS